jgi:type VI secretion system secreted protein VgrG
VKVQFRWDRYGQRNENSSCWVRVSSAWAGSNFGAVNHPRVGQEVIVDFIAGCPDRPIIIGRVYNADQMPPLELPAKATVSGFISRTIKGDGELANHFIIDDDPGCESIKIHAQKDFTLEVENNEMHTVDGERTTIITGADTYTGDTSLDETINGPHTLTVNEGGPQKITVNGGDQFIKVNGGNQQVDVIGNQTIHVTGKRHDTVDTGEDRFIKPHLNETVTGTKELTVTETHTETVGRKILKTTKGRLEVDVAMFATLKTGGFYKANIKGDYTVETDGGDITFRAPGKNWLVEADKVTHRSNRNSVEYKVGVDTTAGEYIRSHAKDEIISRSDNLIQSQAPTIHTYADHHFIMRTPLSMTFAGAASNVGVVAADFKLLRFSNVALNQSNDAVSAKLSGVAAKIAGLFSFF